MDDPFSQFTQLNYEWCSLAPLSLLPGVYVLDAITLVLESNAVFPEQ